MLTLLCVIMVSTVHVLFRHDIPSSSLVNVSLPSFHSRPSPRRLSNPTAIRSHGTRDFTRELWRDTVCRKSPALTVLFQSSHALSHTTQRHANDCHGLSPQRSVHALYSLPLRRWRHGRHKWDGHVHGWSYVVRCRKHATVSALLSRRHLMVSRMGAAYYRSNGRNMYWAVSVSFNREVDCLHQGHYGDLVEEEVRSLAPYQLYF